MIVVDRFEENIAVCENRETGEIINIHKSELPEDVKEGDILVKQNNKYIIDYQEKSKIEERIKSKIQNLFED